MFIPDEFEFAGDLHVGSNVVSLANLHYAPEIQKISLANLLCALGIKVNPGELEKWFTGKKIQKIRKNQKNSKIQKTELILKTINIQFFDHFIIPRISSIHTEITTSRSVTHPNIALGLERLTS
jgi:hypothetical protein